MESWQQGQKGDAKKGLIALFTNVPPACVLAFEEACTRMK
jgi:hypothetical protein